MRDGDVFEGDVELLSTLEEVSPDAIGHSLSLSNQLGGVELCYDRLENFVADRGEDSFVIIWSQILDLHNFSVRSYKQTGSLQRKRILSYLINLGQLLHLGSMQDSQGQADHLQVFGSSRGRDIPRLRSDVVDDALLQPRDQEMCSLIHDLIFDSREAIEDDCSSATLHIIHRSLGERRSDGEWNGKLVE